MRTPSHILLMLALSGCVISPLPLQQDYQPQSEPVKPPVHISMPLPNPPNVCVQDWYAKAKDLPPCVEDWILDMGKQQKEIQKKRKVKKEELKDG